MRIVIVEIDSGDGLDGDAIIHVLSNLGPYRILSKTPGPRGPQGPPGRPGASGPGLPEDDADREIVAWNRQDAYRLLADATPTGLRLLKEIAAAAEATDTVPVRRLVQQTSTSFGGVSKALDKVLRTCAQQFRNSHEPLRVVGPRSSRAVFVESSFRRALKEALAEER